jgi:DNA-binding NarL/FixJ family response regulator
MKLLIVDDHVLFREGLASIIREPDIEIVGLAGTVREAVEMVGTLKPDIILMDFYLPDGTGVEATRAILNEQPQCKIIFLSMSDDDHNLFPAIRSGAKGYILKNISPSNLISALRSVQRGESALSQAMTLRLMHELAQTAGTESPADSILEQLTQREMDVLRELSLGRTNHEIAAHLYISENTVKYHVHSILDKLNLADRKAAARFAREHGLIN